MLKQHFKVSLCLAPPVDWRTFGWVNGFLVENSFVKIQMFFLRCINKNCHWIRGHLCHWEYTIPCYILHGHELDIQRNPTTCTTTKILNSMTVAIIAVNLTRKEGPRGSGAVRSYKCSFCGFWNKYWPTVSVSLATESWLV